MILGSEYLESAPILIIEDDVALAELIQASLSSEGHLASCAHDGPGGLEKLVSLRPHVVLLDLALPPSRSTAEGISLFERIRTTMPLTKVVILTGEADLDTALRCFRNGAADFIEKPVAINKVSVAIERALRFRALEAALMSRKSAKTRLEKVIGASEAMQEVYRKIILAAGSDLNVLLTGETGTGKNLVARTIHDLSRRKGANFLEVNCAGLAESLIESELFGHVRGAFSGAILDKKGVLEAAEGGTLLLDEIALVSPQVQAKLLHVLEDKSIRRVGSSKACRVDVRLIAATNADVRSLLETGRFREDLYYRLGAIQISIPPLRGRKGDIPLLADHFFEQHNDSRFGWIADECYELLAAHSWPGNVRELRNAVQHAMTSADGSDGILGARHFEGRFDAARTGKSRTLRQKLEEYEQHVIQEALDQFDGKVEKVARHLGMSRQNLWKKIRKTGIGRLFKRTMD